MIFEMSFKDIVLGSTLYRQFPGLLVLRIDQDQDRNPGRRVKETVKRVHAAIVGQGKVDQYRHDAVEPRKAFRAASDPFDFKELITGMGQRVHNRFGGDRIVLDQ